MGFAPPKKISIEGPGYGDVHGTDIETLCLRGETGWHASRHP